MANKPFNTRIQLKNDTESNWNLANNFSPLKGELIVYNTDNSHSTPRLKVGDGTTNVNSLPFFQAGVNNLVITTTNTSASDSITAAALTDLLHDGQLVFVILNSAMVGSVNATLQFGSDSAINLYITNTKQLKAAYEANSVLAFVYINNKLIMINPPVAI